MSDPEGWYIVDTVPVRLPTKPLVPGRPAQPANQDSLSPAFPTLELALDEAARRIEPGREVQIRCTVAGSLMRHSEILRKLEQRAARR